MEIVSSSIIEVVNLNDTKPLQLFLSSNQPKTQIYSTSSGVFTPDWNTSSPVLTPELYVAGTPTNILAQAKSVTWYDSGSVIASGANYTLGTNNQSLTINKNVLAGKNLVPSFDSSQWFGDDAGAGKIVVDATDRYKMTLTTTASSQGRLVWIPVITGKTYTISCNQGATTGIRKIYKTKVTTDGPTVIATNNVDTTFTVDSSFNGFVTIRLVAGGAGSFVLQDVQMEEGSSSTGFTPMVTMGTKHITCEVVYTDPDTGYDETIQTGIDFSFVSSGQSGFQGNITGDIGYLTNDTAVITTANDGSGGTYGAPNTATTLQIFRGTKDVTTEYTIAQARTNTTVTEATTSATATVTNLTADTGSVVFTATLANYPTITKTFSLAKTKMGVVGNNPTDYWLNSSVASITAADDGSYNSPTVTFSAESQVGTNAAAAYAARFIIAESTDGTNFTTKYTSAADESSKVYTPSAGLAAIKATLYQAGGTSVKLDDQTVPIINNGKNSVTLSAWTPQGNVIRNGANTVTAQADLYNGGLPDTGTNYRWVKQNGAATSVIAGAGYEDLDLPKRNYLLGSNADWTTTGALATSKNLSPNLTFSADAIAAMNRTGQISVSLDYKVTNLVYGTTNPWVGMEVSVTYSDATQGWYDAAGSTHIPAGSSNGWVRTASTYPLKAGVTVTSVGVTVLVRDCTGTVEMRNFKLETGSKATPWSLAYEEVKVDQMDTTLYGRNLLPNTSNFTSTAHWSTGASNVVALTTNASNNLSIKKIAATDAIHTSVQTTIPIIAGQQYTVTVTGRFNGWDGTSGKWTGFSFADSTGGAFYELFTPSGLPLPTNGTFGTVRGTVTAGHSGILSIAISTTGVQNNLELEIQSIKLEALGYGTDYSPAPEDNAANYPNNAAGENNWIYRNYSDGSNATRKIYGYSDFPSLTPNYQTLVADGASLHYGDYGSYFVGYYKTAVYVSTAKTTNFQFAQDDTVNILVNGIQQGSQLTTQTTAQTYPLSLQAGWNTVELILQEITGSDGIQLTNTLSSLVDEMNCNYALDYGSLKGNYGIMGYNISSMVITTNAVTDTDLFQCLVTYRSSTYKDTVTIDDVTDPIVLQVVGSGYFKNGQGSNSYTAKLYQNGNEIDTSGTQYSYTWYVYNQDGSQDILFGGSGSKTGKTITVSASDINVQGRLVCEVDG